MLVFAFHDVFDSDDTRAPYRADRQRGLRTASCQIEASEMRLFLRGDAETGAWFASPKSMLPMISCNTLDNQP